MQINDITPQEYEALKKAVEHLLEEYEDNAYRYGMAKLAYPNQKALDIILSLAIKLGIRT